MFVLYFIFGCNLNKVECISLKNRVQTIKDQRTVLLELKKINRIGKKKFHKIDDILSEEENLAYKRFKLRCNYEKLQETGKYK